MPATLTDLMADLSRAASNTPAVFRTEAGDIGAGYHVTELKLHDINSIDCGGRLARWKEAQLQLLDKADGEHLTAGKVHAILSRCLQALPGLADVPLSVEFAPGNRGLARYNLGAVTERGDRLELPLIDDQALCKPAAETGCCGPTACCG
jgi:hypothetical protein